MNPASLPPDDEEVAGLAGERTDLAWSRSGLAVLVCAAALLKRVLVELEGPDGTGDTGPRSIVFGLLVAGAAAWVAVLLHSRAVARSTLAGRRLADPALLRGVALATLALAAIATLLSLLP